VQSIVVTFLGIMVFREIVSMLFAINCLRFTASDMFGKIQNRPKMSPIDNFAGNNGLNSLRCCGFEPLFSQLQPYFPWLGVYACRPQGPQR
jgi:hypothetical protein